MTKPKSIAKQNLDGSFYTVGVIILVSIPRLDVYKENGLMDDSSGLSLPWVLYSEPIPRGWIPGDISRLIDRQFMGKKEGIYSILVDNSKATDMDPGCYVITVDKLVRPHEYRNFIIFPELTYERHTYANNFGKRQYKLEKKVVNDVGGRTKGDNRDSERRLLGSKHGAKKVCSRIGSYKDRCV